MRWARPVLTASAAALIFCSAPGTSRAQTARSGGAANSVLQQQLQQLASERTRLQTENEKLKKGLGDAQKELAALKEAQKSQDTRAKESVAALAQSKTERASTEEQLRQVKDKMDQLIAKFRETAQALRDTEGDRASTKQTLAARDQQLHVCIDRNLALYKINDEVLTRLEKESVWSRIAEAEPFTRLKRTEMENLVDDYKAQADDQRVAPAAAPSPAATAPQHHQ